MPLSPPSGAERRGGGPLTVPPQRIPERAPLSPRPFLRRRMPRSRKKYN
jgi:hypothetical protein